MKFVILIKNKLENIYKKYPRIIGYAGRLAICVVCFLLLRINCGYNSFLTNIWTVLIMSLFCAFAPSRFLMLIMVAYTIIQMFYLSMGVGVVCAAIFLAVYLIFFRFDTRQIYILFLIPILSMLRLTALIPLVLAVVGGLDAIAVVLLGNLLYYVIRYINLNAAVISGMTQESEYTKMSFAVKGIFTNAEFLYTLAILLVVFLVVYYMRKLNLNQVNNLAIAAGSGIYIILSIIANLIFGTVTFSRLGNIVIGGIISGLLAALIVYAILPLDYTRVETFEFEDEEYHYYVRAVPKAVIKKESVKVKKINSRKEIPSKKVKEGEQ